MTTTKTLTRQKVHTVLRKAGFRRSEWERSGMSRGFGSWSRGYHVYTDIDGAIYVEHTGDAVNRDYDAQVERYLQALARAGIDAESCGDRKLHCRGYSVTA